MKHFCVLFFALVLSFQGFRGQTVPSPEAFLGYELGSRFTPHHRVVAYFQAVATASPLITLVPYGKTPEGRQLQYAVLSAPANQQRLDEIRTNNLIRTGLKEGEVKGSQLPVIWMSYNIHGDEAVCTEAAMASLYHFLTDSQVQSWLESLVVIIDPCLNPDGRDRYVNWYNQTTTIPPNASPLAWEHHQPWPGGRFNHYLFDLNRDWCWQSQPESRLRVREYHRWMPQVHVDFHEMGYNSPYFFAPAAEPYHPELSDWQLAFQQIMGTNHARYFDEKHWLYYTNEVFDLFYPSYGDTWSLFNGAQGFTYEQGGSGRAGRIVARDRGDTLRLSDRLAHHFATAYSTVEVSYQNRERLLREYNAYFASAASKPSGKNISYVIRGHDQNPSAVQAFTQMLSQNQIKFGFVSPTQAGRRLSGFSYQNKKPGEKFELQAGDLIVNTYQPQAHLVRVLLEAEAKLSDSLTYDLTAWSLPYAFNLETYATEALIQPALNQWKFSEPPPELGPKPYAIVVPWRSWQSARLLSQLLRAGIKVRQAHAAFSIKERTYREGSLVITAAENAEDYAKTVSKMAREYSCPIQFHNSGMTDEGRDLGSASLYAIKPVRVGLVGGESVSPTAFGEIWHFFEQDLQYPITLLTTSYLDEIGPNDFDILILPSGNYEEFHQFFLDFARAGGRIIALDRALATFSEKVKEGKNTRLAEALEIAEKEQKKDENAHLLQLSEDLDRYADRERSFLSNTVAGSIYRVQLDPSHPLAFGYGESFFILKRNRMIYPLLGNGTWNVGFFPEDSHMAGFVGAQLKARVDKSLTVGVEAFGRGKLIYFADSPIFRGFWWGGKLMLANAIFSHF